ncbi:MAG: hypothetical protein IJQ99_06995 [Synergistaceae bacterium]|nr:hypothetical protein [Synergistaceae bacterium]
MISIDKNKTAENIAVAQASETIIQRYGNAAKEFVVAYEGIDNATGQALQKGLKNISGYKVNPKYEAQNLRQQSGFSAEVLDTAKKNAHNIVKGNSARAARTDDIAKRVDEKFGDIGGVNETRYDQAELRGNKVVSVSQYKYVEKDSTNLTYKLHSKNYQEKYFNDGTKITVPEDFYQGAIEKDPELKNKILQGKITKSEAEFAVRNPKLATAKEIAKVGHVAGLEGAEYGAAIGGGISAVRNIVSVISGEKDFGDAAIEVVYDTGTGAAIGYISNFGMSALLGVMKNSSSGLIRSMAESNMPAQIAIAVFEAGKTLLKYSNGEISGTECVEELQEKGVGMAGAIAGAEIGQAVIPIPVVGAVAGSIIGYAVSSAWYNELKNIINLEKIAYEEYLRIERECNEAIEALKEYRKKIEALISKYMIEHITAFHTAFDVMKDAFETGDIDGFISGTNMITKKLGGTVQFNDMREFDELMMSSEALVL